MEAGSEQPSFIILPWVTLAKNQYGDKVGSGYIINPKKQRLIFFSWKVAKTLKFIY